MDLTKQAIDLQKGSITAPDSSTKVVLFKVISCGHSIPSILIDLLHGPLIASMHTASRLGRASSTTLKMMESGVLEPDHSQNGHTP